MDSMKISSISDVHVKAPGDEADCLLNQFLDHPEVRSSNHVLLLGDIFDLMTGQHDQYLRDYGHIFRKMDDLVTMGVKVHFFEGNHDVNLQKLFRKFWPNGEVTSQLLPEIQEWDGKTYYFSHGDEHEIHNQSYQRYKKFINSKPLHFVANYIMPYSILKFVGERASLRSRKKGSKTFNHEAVRQKFREGVSQVTGGKYNFVLGGHSHVKDEFVMEGGESIYLNNGYALRTKTFILINNHQHHFIPLA
jgi:UDP-2,3-diacylglucosamine hydrolase